MVYAFISPIACIPMESKMMENKTANNKADNPVIPTGDWDR